MKYQKKSLVIEATQWFKMGDHPEDNQPDVVVSAVCAAMFPEMKEGDTFKGEGKVVRYYRHPAGDGKTRKCEKCGVIMHDHGWIDTLEGGHIVCPGDCIITGIKGERYPCKPDIFAATYELPQAEGEHLPPVR